MRRGVTIVSIGMTIVSIALLALAEPASAAQSRTYTVSVSRHVDTDSLSDEQVREILAGASDLLQKNNCDITFTLKGRVHSFGSGGRPPSTVNKDDIDAVHRIGESTDPEANLHVEVVKAIPQFCRFEGGADGFVGCAWPINFKSIIVVDHPEGDRPETDADRIKLASVLWAHEFGHLMGLGHTVTNRKHLMTYCPTRKDQKLITRHECECFLSGPGFGPNGICNLSTPCTELVCGPQPCEPD